MANLTDTAYYSRMVIKFGGVALIAIMVGRFGYGVLRAWYLALNPPAPPPPEVAFGVLPDLQFPNTTQPSVIYHLETANSQLPYLGDRAAVYVMPNTRPRLFSTIRPSAPWTSTWRVGR